MKLEHKYYILLCERDWVLVDQINSEPLMKPVSRRFKIPEPGARERERDQEIQTIYLQLARAVLCPSSLSLELESRY